MKQNIAAIKEKIDKLNETIEFHKDAYYVQSAPVISDKEYDNLVDELNGLVETYNALVSEKEQLSPYESVGAKTPSNKFKHPFPMLSLEKIKFEDTMEFEYEEFEQVMDWLLKRFKMLQKSDLEIENESIKEKIGIMVMPKFDGIALELIYHNGLLTHASTRGDGEYGKELDIERVKRIKSIPSDIRQYFKEGMVVVRGEVLFSRADFERLYPDKKIGISRNVANGVLMSSSDENIASLSFFIFQMNVFDSDGKEIPYKPSFFSNIHLFNGGNTVTVCDTTNESYYYAVAAIANKVTESTDYKKDGIVIKIDDYDVCKALGETKHHPRYAVAIKMYAESAPSKILRFDYGSTHEGVIVPFAEIEPIELNGSLITYVHMFNLNYLKEHKLQIGDTVLIKRAGDVIPQYVRTLEHAKTEQSLIDCCPFCNSKIEYEGYTPGTSFRKLPYCTNVKCKNTLAVKLTRWLSIKQLGNLCIGTETVRRLQKEGVWTVVDLLKFNPSKGGILNEKQIEGLNKFKTYMENELDVGTVLTALGCHPYSVSSKELDKIKDLKELLDSEGLSRHAGKLRTNKHFLGQTTESIYSELKSSLNEYIGEDTSLPSNGREVIMGLIELGICTR